MSFAAKFVNLRVREKKFPENLFFGDFFNKSGKNEVNNMSMENKIKATAKNIEGKAQEMMGEITGNPEDKAEGKAKQAVAKAEHTVENVKDKVKEKVE